MAWGSNRAYECSVPAPNAGFVAIAAGYGHSLGLKGPTICRGDLNCDGVISFDDINPFVLALSNWTEWKNTYPNCPQQNADVNGDGQYGGLNGFGDINPFVELLAGSGGQPIPCP